MIFLIAFGLALWIITSCAELYFYRKKLSSIPLRIHVNGIRGKSTIVRYISAILRSQNYKTLGKTTGSAPRIMGFLGEEILLQRSGRPNIFEQYLLMKHFIGLKPQAIVVECMATNPLYSEWLEDKVMRSHIYIMTNVRIDHQDQLGYTLKEIAKSLSLSIPYNATLITGETNTEVINIFNDICIKRNTRLIAPCINNRLGLKSIDTTSFHHTPVAENLRICLAFSALLHISEEQALAAMADANPDPGQFRIKTIFLNGTEIQWCNLFAVNDKESFFDWAHLLVSVHQSFKPVIILNNRNDRMDRVPIFIDCISSLGIRNVVTMGDCEKMVESILGLDFSILKLGNSSLFANLNGEDLLRRIALNFKGQRILLIGAVNIHTKQADSLLAYLDQPLDDSLEQFGEDLY